MVQTKTSNMQNSIQNQREMNQVMAYKIGCDELAAHSNSIHVLRSLEVPVTDRLFVSLVNLCYKVGIHEFSNSTALELVNANSKKALVYKCISTMIGNRVKLSTPIKQIH